MTNDPLESKYGMLLNNPGRLLRKWRRNGLTFLFGAVAALMVSVLTMTGCATGGGAADPAAVQALNELLRDGVITSAQYSALVASMSQETGWVEQLVTSVGPVVAGLFGIRWAYGSPKQVRTAAAAAGAGRFADVTPVV